MNTRHLILTVAFGIGTLGAAPARAQDSAVATATLTAKLRSAAVPQRSVLDRDRSELLLATPKSVSERKPANDEPERVGRGELIEALLRWTDRLMTRLDPLGMLETPFQPGPSGDATSVDRVGAPNPPVRQWKPIPRVRPVQLPGGYGLVARITF